VKLTITNKLTIEGAPKELLDVIKQKLTFPNPQYEENKKMNRWNGNTPPFLKFYQEAEHGLVVPRGFTGAALRMGNDRDIQVGLLDKTRQLPDVQFEFDGHLRPYQEDAVENMLKKNFGTLEAPTGSGKTIMACNMIHRRQQPVIIITHTKELANQWVNRISQFLQIPKAEIGIIGNGRNAIGENVTVALVQSLYKCSSQVSPRVGYLIVDECHRTPSRTFTEAVSAFDCKYMTGLSATPWRRDGLSSLITFFVGRVVHKIESSDLISTGNILKAEPVIRETNFRTKFDPAWKYSQMLSELTKDRARNEFIAQDVAREATNGGGICLILSDRKTHCQELKDILERLRVNSDLLTGDLPKHVREEVIERLNSGQTKVLIATGQLIGEGFDLKELSTLFLATPISFNGRLLQYLGRILRPAPGKTMAKVYDYVDVHVGVLKISASARQRIYNLGNKTRDH